MGQQQLLLIILGVIVVGIAVAVGITMFNDSATSANRDAVTNDLINLASRAQQYYRRPTALGGGGGSFATLSGNIKLLTKTSGSSDGQRQRYLHHRECLGLERAAAGSRYRDRERRDRSGQGGDERLG